MGIVLVLLLMFIIFFLFDVGNDLRSNLFMREEIIRIIRKHCI